MIRTQKHRNDFKWRLNNNRRETDIWIDLVLNREYLITNAIREKDISNSRFAKAKNICYISGKSRGILRFGFSRHGIKFLGTRGLWLGLKKASW
jgi:ribosomal protein S14